ncbi:ATP-binding protein [Roseateles sp. BYS78W]|uniref:ATP-binding protein n=1 Tax=Pelomonas candidula TaxID=3299025 RepID=A0ABW7HHF5_9BURK
MTSSEAVQTAPVLSPAVIEFGPFRYDRARREISDGQGRLRLGSRALHILDVLLEEPGRLYSREELVTRVWPQTVVEETSLRVHVSALRKVLGDGQGGVRYIANVPGRGYAFVGELRADPSPGGDALAPPPADALPASLSRPIGREQVIAQIGELLACERLVSIVGAGGMGKTTVALAVTAGLRATYAHGACLVDLSRLSDPALVAGELGQALGLIVPRDNPLAMLEAALRDKQMLFFIDNCEHVVDAVASLVDRLMRTCPGLAFLATSREPLEIEAEWVFKLPPLSLPDVEDTLDAQDLLAYPAIQLFVERARAISATFELTDAHAPAVRQLCGFLDGIPLAIELAAARVDSLGVQGLLHRLENAFELLTRGRRTALSRHRTLQAVMDWSYDLLSDSERLVLQRLSVFRGAFDLDGAVTVASDGALTQQRIVEDVLALCAKSLVVPDAADDERPLHRLLYITRLYAEKQLANSADAAAVHRRHATFILEGLQRARQAGAGMSRYHWSPALGSSIADVRAAIDWALAGENDVELGVQLTALAKRLYADVGRAEEYLQLNALAMARAEAVAAESDRDRLELPLRMAAVFMTGHAVDGRELCRPLFTRMRELLDRLGTKEDRIEALYSMSTTAFGHGDYRLSLALCEEIRTLADGDYAPLSIAISDRVAALNLHALGRNDAAETLARRVLAFNGVRIGRQFLSVVPFGVSMRVLLARLQWVRGDFEQAWQMLTEALEGSMNAHVFALCQTLGTAAVPMAFWRGDVAQASQWARDLWEVAERQSLPYWRAFALVFMRVLAGDAIKPGDEAAIAVAQCAQLGDVVATMRPVGPPPDTRLRVEAGEVGWCAPEVLRLLALEADCDATDMAMTRLEAALKLAEEQGARFWMLRIALSMANIAPGTAAPALATVRRLLSCLDDGSAIPELAAARALLKDRA